MTPYKGEQPEIGWSIHMTGGWKTQLVRVQRWHGRVLNAENPEDRYDFLYAFFENAFHLRDWLQDTRAVSKSEMEAFFENTTEMGLCRDLANAHKHYSLRSPSQPAPPSEVHEYTPGTGNLSSDISLMILSDGTKHDAFELATRILRTWESFVANVPATE